MAVKYEGNGVGYTYSGITLAAISIQLPGWSKTEIDATTLANTAVMTTVLAALKEYGSLVITAEWDPALHVGLSGSNGALVITGLSTSITYYANLQAIDPVDLENGVRPVNRLTFKITNLNGTTETIPAFA